MINIHERTGSFSDEWIKYCDEKQLQYRKVDCFDSNIVRDLNEGDILLWHWHHADVKAKNFARSLIQTLEKKNIKVFPNINTCWHFDDKIGQKYLLEAIDAPIAKTYVFYSKPMALQWARDTQYPKVFKLRGGAGSEHVKLIRTYAEAQKYINKSFNSGWKAYSRLGPLRERLWHLKRDFSVVSAVNVLRGVFRFFFPNKIKAQQPIQRHYLYAQDFLAGNSFDIRIVVIGDRAFGIRRMVRKGDFRASGSGVNDYDHTSIPPECVNIAFETTEKIGAQSLAFDFIYSGDTPKIIEISYAYSQKAYRQCPGYWDRECHWHEQTFILEHFIIEDILNDKIPQPYQHVKSVQPETKIAIFDIKNSNSEKWIHYCEKKSIPYVRLTVDDDNNNIVDLLKTCTHFLWDWHQNEYKVLLFSIPLTYALRHLDIKVYPNIDTSYYYDSKIGQKYLLEAIDAPLVTTHIFYDRDKALDWFVKKAELPVVFKLSTGAGSENVMLIRSHGQGNRFIKKIFSRGFKGYSRLGPLKERVWHFWRDKSISSFINISRGIFRMVFPNKTKMSLQTEKGYLYTQEFIPDNDSDIRIYLVGSRAYGMKRMVRQNDFRASGSGLRSCDATVIPIECVQLAFQVNSKLKAQTLAFDFVFSKSKPLIVEISYATVPHYYDDCGGFWDTDLNRHEGPFSIPEQIMDDLLAQSDKDSDTNVQLGTLNENR